MEEEQEQKDTVEEGCPKDTSQESRQPSLKQYLAAGVVSGFGGVSVGTVMGFSAILLPQLEEEDEDGGFTAESGEASWMASLSNIGMLISSPFIGLLLTRLGRRGALLALCVPSCAGWALVAASGGRFGWMCAGRILQGVGGFSSAMQLYMVEIADVENRGTLGSFGALSVSVGITLVYALGACLPWRTVAIICGILPVALSLSLPFLPESPIWLATKNKETEARKSLRWLRGGKDCDVEHEMKSLFSASSDSKTSDKDLKEEENEAKALVSKERAKKKKKSSVWNTLKEYRHRRSYLPLIILLAVFVLMQWSGSFAVIFYAVNLFSDLGVSSSAYASAIVVGTVRFLGTLLGTMLVSRYQRRHIMLASSGLTALSMAVLATVAQKEPDHEGALSSADTTLSHYLPVVLVVFYMMSFGFGIGTVPWILMGELCPASTKGLSSGLVTSVSFACVFLVVKLFPYLTSTFSLGSTFAIFSSVCIANFAFCLVFLPETKGKTLGEVQDIFDK